MLTQLDLRNIIRIEENRKEVNKMNARIEAVRKHEGLTQEQFADRINLSRNYLWMLENGSRTPSDRTISDICREFGVREAWLRTGEGEMFVQDTQSEQVAAFLADLTKDDSDTFKKRFVEMLAGLSPADWELLERMAEKLTQKKRGKPVKASLAWWLVAYPIRWLAYTHTSRSWRKSAFSSSFRMALMVSCRVMLQSSDWVYVQEHYTTIRR